MVTTEEMLYGSPGPDWKPNFKLLYTLASSNGWPHKAVKAFIMERFKRESTKDLRFSEYNATMEQVSLPYEED